MKALIRSDKRSLIRQKISELAEEPLALASNVKKLQGRPEYRLRVQDWRVIFRIEDDVLWIDDVGPRGSVY
ncbi:MAG: mRNA interferase RelE/StbE [Sphingomonadales bacterium]|jgi:mRNA interferase RelE/StbE|nr:mRNA interferase RelE/StbE [Sphingomonadales bacterium]MEA3044887.1 mRNA interferase RelE/StbE [Sphingomonadales bacterium]